MWYLWLLLGVLVGSVITVCVCLLKSSIGVLRIDCSNPEKDTYRFDLKDIDKLSKKKLIVLKVDNKADLSR